ncbi:MAG: recombinase RecA [Eubacteriales bacterium]|nr:recombinase RecA [Eubacteriales bacterium]MDO4389932.1 recombinase RecA [Eubacteriales bacterium]
MADKKGAKEKEKVTQKTGDERKTALDNAIARIEKDFGKGSVMKLGESQKMQVEVIPTGCLSLDFALGVGGLPKGRIIEIYGPESSGKTTLALHTVAEAQKAGGIAAFIDAEHALDPVYARALGVDIDNLYVSQPDNGEQALDICEALVRSGAIDIVVIDSVAALVPKAEIEGDMGDSHVGLQARLMSQALRKLAGVIAKTNAVAVFINQLREKVGVVYGNPEVTTGGKALKFYASVRIDIRKGEPIKDGTQLIGNRAKIKIVKNKVAPPFRSCTVDMLYGQGISRAGELLDMAVEKDLIVKSGAWYSYQGQRIGQGRDNARKYLEENPQVFDELLKIVRDEFMNGEGVPLEIGGNENDTPETEAEGASLAEAVEDDDLDLDGEF